MVLVPLCEELCSASERHRRVIEKNVRRSLGATYSLPTGGFFGFVTAQVSRFERDESGPVQSASLWPGCAKPVRCASSSVAPPLLRPTSGHMIALGIELMLKEYRRPAAGHTPDPSVRAADAIAPPGRWVMVDAKLTRITCA